MIISDHLLNISKINRESKLNLGQIFFKQVLYETNALVPDMYSSENIALN